jgi:(4-(4-[2-(gamma-L-glutamylamino)ethyl]phenoxymethyl)furan-2-yl)methanamine synthase
VNVIVTGATIGWDIGGAHLKAVLLDAKGNVQQVAQLPCPLWKGLNCLEAAIQHVLQIFKLEASEAAHAITMTGELVDLFVNRHEGIVAISTLSKVLLGEDTLFYAANIGFVGLERVSALTPYIASTNWHASASALAMHVGDALLVDIGSTTSDIILIENGKVTTSNLTDGARMTVDSLVYTGVVRTPVMALAQKLPFEGAQVNVAAEYFSTMADVYRLTGELKKDDAETADGKGKTQLESARRLARMVGCDVENYPIATWISLAKTCKTLQMNQIKAAILKHLKPNMSLLGAGAGSFLAQQIAADLNCEYTSACEAISMRSAAHVDLSLQHEINTCFPAYAVALLALNHQHA